MRRIFSLFLFLCFSFQISAQVELQTQLEKQYRNYSLDKVETSALFNQINSKNTFHIQTLTVGGQTFTLELWDSGLRSKENVVTLAKGSSAGMTHPIPLKGYIKGDPASTVRLTVNDGFLQGYIRQNGRTLNIQPAYYFDNKAPRDLVLSFYDKDVIADHSHHKCGVGAKQVVLKDQITSSTSHTQKKVGECFEVEIALAADWLMFDDYGSESAVENQITSVLNDVQGNYDDEFADAIEYDLTDVWISNCNSCDPWTSSNSADDLLDDFTDWAPSNLGGHDVATLWSARNFSGSTIGLAWVGAVCTNFSYNVCEDFSNSANFLRVLQAHELGHNWDATHDSGGGFIMSPSVNSSTVWSSDSKADIEDYATSAGCFGNCSSGNPPTADFEYEITEACVVAEVEYTDLSSGANQWEWTFEGGTPSTSTEQNPVVQYAIAGTYDVTLEVFNAAGDDELELEDEVEIVSGPIADFDYETDELEVDFYDNSGAGADGSFLWEFGDGTTSTDQDPFHFYASPGIYTVTFYAENDCGDDEISIDIEVFDEPEALFTVDTVRGCPLDTFQFTDLSYGGIESWEWTFLGGTANDSTIANPFVYYTNPGIYDVQLRVTNPEGSDRETKRSYISVDTLPTAGYTFSTSANTVTFNNSSNFADSYLWDFGDGTTSTDTSTTHVYAGSGTYSVVLAAMNSCTTAYDTQTVVINVEPLAGFTTSGSTAGCATHTVTFLDTSAGIPSSWNWSFPGGTPSSSTLRNPTVEYTSAGSYPATLEVTNAFGSNSFSVTDYIVVDDVPTLSSSFTRDIMTVSFTSTTTNSTNLLWDFGDGQSATESNPIHTYTTPGTYEVSVVSTNDCGQVSNTLAISVSLLPSANISADNTAICAQETVSFSDVSGNDVTSWNWSFPGGTPSTSTLQNPVVSYNQAGTYDVSLTITNRSGSDTQTFDNYVAVTGTPEADYEFTQDGNRLNLMNLTAGTSTLWTISDGTSYTTSEVSHVFDSNGTYQVTLDVMNQCGTDQRSFSVLVNAYTISAFTSTTPEGCTPLTVTYESQSPNAESYNWNFPGGMPSTATGSTATVVYITEGSYDASLRVSNSFNSDESTRPGYVKLTSPPELSYEFNVVGNTVELLNTSSESNPQWIISDGATYIDEAVTHTFDANGTYDVSIAVSNACGTKTESFEVVINAFLELSFEADETVGCIPHTVNYTSTVNTAVDNYAWLFPGGTPEMSFEPNPTVVYETVGTYDAILEATNATGVVAEMKTALITVSDVPEADFSFEIQEGALTLENLSIGATSYVWNFGDGTTSTEEHPNHSYAEAGIYDVILTATNDCGSVTTILAIDVDITSSIEDINLFGEWNLRPNPSEGQVELFLSKPLTEQIMYRIIDLGGRVLFSDSLKIGSTGASIEIEEAGIYFLQLQSGAHSSIKKLVVI